VTFKEHKFWDCPNHKRLNLTLENKIKKSKHAQIMNGKKRKEKFTSWKEQTGSLSKLLFS
jgi:hypothetical protein